MKRTVTHKPTQQSRPTEGKRLECACRERVRYGSLTKPVCQQCGGSGYVLVKDWSKDKDEKEQH